MVELRLFPGDVGSSPTEACTPLLMVATWKRVFPKGQKIEGSNPSGAVSHLTGMTIRFGQVFFVVVHDSQYDDEGYPKKAVSRVVDGTSILPNRWYKLDEFGEFHLTKRKMAL